MKILVTGGAGYIGCKLVPELLDTGATVRVVDKLVFGEEGLNGVGQKVDLIESDIRNLTDAELRGVDTVVHLAGLSNDPTAEFNAAANRAINLDSTLMLAGLAKQAGVRRFVFASSCSVYYTEVPEGRLCVETDPVEPKAPYSWSKRQAEIGVLALASPHFCPVVLRMGTVFGYSPRMRFDLVVNTFTRDAYARRRLTVQAGGRMWRPLLHIADAVEAYKCVIAADEDLVRGQIFNVLSENYQVLSIAHDVRRALEERGVPNIALDVQPVGVSRSYRVDGRKFGECLGVRLSRDVRGAVHEMWEAIASIQDLENPIFYNITWLELLADMEHRLRRMGGSPF
jgi:nucleoside-diphosphate-sugar epimerase